MSVNPDIRQYQACLAPGSLAINALALQTQEPRVSQCGWLQLEWAVQCKYLVTIHAIHQYPTAHIYTYMLPELSPLSSRLLAVL